MRDPRHEKLAAVLVGYSVAVKKDDLVRISGSPAASALIIEIYRKVLEAGGHPFVRMAPDDLQEVFLKTASPEQLQYISPLAKFEVETIDCSIDLWAEQNTRALTNCDPERMRISAAARRPISEIFLKRAAEGKLRWVGTQFPTNASAQDAEMSLAEYEDFVFAAGHLDKPDPVACWKRISEQQQRLVDYLQGRRDLRIVAANGTDLRMSVAGRRWINCDGHENFPDGEVFTGPVLDSVEGTIRFSFPAVHHGREVLDVRLTFRSGRVVDASAAKGEDYLLKMLDTDEGSRLVGEIAFGCNYQIRRYTKNTLFDEKIGGTMHLALGAGYPETGNDNRSGLHWDMVVDLRDGGYVELDGEKINIDGVFRRDGFPTA